MARTQRPVGGLAGRSIVVTRPAGQAAGLAALIGASGGEPLLYPALEIREIAATPALLAIFDRLDEFDLAVFISRNAVERGLAMLRARRGAGWPVGLRVAAIGSGSRQALEQQGFAGVIAPAGRADTEALLALPAFRAAAGRRVLVVRGEGGREALGDALRARGASVEYAECYRRLRAETDCAPLLAAWARGEVDAVTVSSGEGLEALASMIGTAGVELMRGTPLFVPHPRVLAPADALGARLVRVAGPADEEVVAALVAYFRDAK